MPSYFLPSPKYGDIVIPKIEGTEPLPMELNHFIDCIMSNKEQISNDRSGLYVVKILGAAQRSLYKGNNRVPVAEEQ